MEAVTIVWPAAVVPRRTLAATELSWRLLSTPVRLLYLGRGVSPKVGEDYFPLTLSTWSSSHN